VLAAVACLLAAGAHAERTDAASVPSGQTTMNSRCIQEAAGFNLNCTANDVNVAGVATDEEGDRIWIIDPCQFPDDDVTFIAEFAVQLNAQDRHDVGIYFATDGDSGGDGALTSDDGLNGCSVTVLDYQEPDWVDLDGTSDPRPGERKASGMQDTCGDIDADHSPLYPAIEVTAKCVDSDGDGFLNLPNCVSWRQSGANELCMDAGDTFPGAPSKCKCDTGFNVPVPVPAAVSFKKEVRVAGTSDPYAESVTFDESGGFAEYRITYSFPTGPTTPDVTLTSLTDVPYGDITYVHGDITSTNCSAPSTLSGNGSGSEVSYSCSFVTRVGGNPRTITDTVTATAMDAVGNDLSKSDSASVVITNSQPKITVDKTANPESIKEPGGDVAFTVKITNDSSVSDPVTINSLVDKIGSVEFDLDGQGSCSVGQTILPGQSYTCIFTTAVSGNAGESQTDTVTAIGEDDDKDSSGLGTPVTDSDSATVAITDVPGAIKVTKVADVDSCNEPSCDVIFTITIENMSLFDTVFIDKLEDLVSGDASAVDLEGECKMSDGSVLALPLTIVASGKVECSFERSLLGNAGDVHTNTVTASGTDDDGQSVSDSDDETVTFNNVAPAASVAKSVERMDVTYEVVISNDSEAESLYLSKLEDDRFCDITTTHGAGAGCEEVLETTCATGWIEANGEYKCTFKGVVTTSPHTNTVTATLDDDDAPDAPVTPSDDATVTFGND
jgi:hypothetical protein